MCTVEYIENRGYGIIRSVHPSKGRKENAEQKSDGQTRDIDKSNGDRIGIDEEAVNEDEDGEHTLDEQVGDGEHKEFVVPEPHGIVEPNTEMVHSQHIGPQFVAEVGARRTGKHFRQFLLCSSFILNQQRSVLTAVLLIAVIVSIVTMMAIGGGIGIAARFCTLCALLLAAIEPVHHFLLFRHVDFVLFELGPQLLVKERISAIPSPLHQSRRGKGAAEKGAK